MKKLVLATLAIMISASNALASEGDADKLAGSAIGLFYLVVGIFLLGSFLVGVSQFFDWCKDVWSKSTTAGRLIIFGIPLTAVSTCIFYGLFYYVIPFVVNTIVPSIVYTTSGKVIVGIIMYCICMLVGWTENYCNSGAVKRDGHLATVARGIVLFPVLPVLYIGYYIIQLFKKICLKDAKIELTPYIVRKKYWGRF